MSHYDAMYDEFWGDARHCPRHPSQVTSSPDGMFDCECSICEHESDQYDWDKDGPTVAQQEYANHYNGCEECAAISDTLCPVGTKLLDAAVVAEKERNARERR